MTTLAHADDCRADTDADPKILDRTCRACRETALYMSLQGQRYETRPWPGEHRRTT